MPGVHLTRTIHSTININAHPEAIWENITNVRIEKFADPKIFRLLGIPRPLRADLFVAGNGGKRIAYFDSGKKFIQEITRWVPLKEYAFKFNPEKGFKVGYLFDLSDGVFQIPDGAYFLTSNSGTVRLELLTTYSLDRRVYLLLNIPVRILLQTFQKYLLTSIKKNSES